MAQRVSLKISAFKVPSACRKKHPFCFAVSLTNQRPTRLIPMLAASCAVSATGKEPCVTTLMTKSSFVLQRPTGRPVIFLFSFGPFFLSHRRSSESVIRSPTSVHSDGLDIPSALTRTYPYPAAVRPCTLNWKGGGGVLCFFQQKRGGFLALGGLEVASALLRAGWRGIWAVYIRATPERGFSSRDDSRRQKLFFCPAFLFLLWCFLSSAMCRSLCLGSIFSNPVVNHYPDVLVSSSSPTVAEYRLSLRLSPGLMPGLTNAGHDVVLGDCSDPDLPKKQPSRRITTSNQALISIHEHWGISALFSQSKKKMAY